MNSIVDGKVTVKERDVRRLYADIQEQLGGQRVALVSSPLLRNLVGVAGSPAELP